jgi:hypothetical protein
MKTKEQEVQKIIDAINSLKGSKITYNPELDKREGLVLFPEKMKRAKEHIAKVGMPKAYYDQIAKNKKEKEE